MLLSLVFPRLHKINEIVSLQHVFTKLFDIENLFRLVQLFFPLRFKEREQQTGRQADEKNICETQNNVSCEQTDNNVAKRWNKHVRMVDNSAI